MRADARRNRELLLSTARTLFAERGADVSLAAVAAAAGVGVGTAYRHFPTHEALVEAAYRDEVTALCDAATTLLAEQPPDEALSQWLHLCVDYLATKRGMSKALRAITESGSDVNDDARTRIIGALTMLLAAAQGAGTVRADVGPEDVAATLGGLYLIPEDPAMAHRILNVVIDGLRRRAPR